MSAVFGYASRWSVAPGERIDFMISRDVEGEFEARLERVFCGDRNPQEDCLKRSEISSPLNGTHHAFPQHTQVGSWVRMPVMSLGASFTIAMLVLPTRLEAGEQCLAAQTSDHGTKGFALSLTADGTLAADLGDGQRRLRIEGGKLRAREWSFVALSFCGAAGTATLASIPMSRPLAQVFQSAEGVAVAPAAAAFTLAARLQKESTAGIFTCRHFNGKLERPEILSRALSSDELIAWAGGQWAPAEKDLVARWNFALKSDSDVIVDEIGGAHGSAYNLPLRAVTGHKWSGRSFDFRAAGDEYGAIHFHDDDVGDCRWKVSLTFEVPETLDSGLYCLRLSTGAHEDEIPFFVRPACGRPGAPVAFLAPTHTYMAYANERGGSYLQSSELLAGRLVTLSSSDAAVHAHPEFGMSLYDCHSDGSFVAYTSCLRPMLNMRPSAQTWTGPPPSALRWLAQDTHMLGWLDAIGQSVDCITDDDLHAEGMELLSNYRVLILGSHPEYWSTPMHDALAAFLNGGGRLLYLGANGLCWRTSASENVRGVIEVRRWAGGYPNNSDVGESHHSFTGELGGRWRILGRPEERWLGVGYNGEGFDICGHYRRSAASYDARAAFIFDSVEDEIIGDFGLNGGGAVGMEIDAATPDSPPNLLILATSEGLSDTYCNGGDGLLSPQLAAPSLNPATCGQMSFYETEAGGAVFAAGSIAWSASLPVDGYHNNVARITENLLRRFLDPTPFAVPGAHASGTAAVIGRQDCDLGTG